MTNHLLLALAFAASPVSTPSAQPTVAAVVTDSADMQSALDRAEKLTFAGRIGEARAIYRKLIDDAREAGEYARQPLWHLTMHYLHLNDNRNAAATLDELARQSNKFGDPSMELRATFEAAILWTKSKEPGYTEARAERIKDLLKSPVIAEAEKREFKRRMI